MLIKDLRSVLPGIPLLALPATVQNNERAKLIKACGMIQPVIVDVSPNKENITFTFMAIPNEKEVVFQLKWLADMVAEKGKESPQTIVFCNMFNFLLLAACVELKRRHSLMMTMEREHLFNLGVYHAKSWESQKGSIEEDFKSHGLNRVVISTCALGMGINFPRVR